LGAKKPFSEKTEHGIEFYALENVGVHMVMVWDQVSLVKCRRLKRMLHALFWRMVLMAIFHAMVKINVN
jgi:hypothetical protein